MLSHTDGDNYYTYMDVDRSASKQQIKRAYKIKALEVHPDKNPNDPTAEDKFSILLEAYETLSNDEKRKEYDNKLNANRTEFHTAQPFNNQAQDQNPVIHGTPFQLFWNIRPSRRYNSDGIDFIIGSLIATLFYTIVSLFLINRDSPNIIAASSITVLVSVVLGLAFFELGILMVRNPKDQIQLRHQLLFMDSTTFMILASVALSGLCYMVYTSSCHYFDLKPFSQGFFFNGFINGFIIFYLGFLGRYLKDRYGKFFTFSANIVFTLLLSSSIGGIAILWTYGIQRSGLGIIITNCLVLTSLASILTSGTLTMMRPSRNMY